MKRRSRVSALVPLGPCLLLPLAVAALCSGEGSSAGALAPKEREEGAVVAAPEGESLSPTAITPGPGAASREGASTAGRPLQLAQAEPAAATPASPPVEAPAPPQAPPSARTGILATDSDQPLSIKADELEAIELPGGGRQLVFTRSVQVEQGDLSVRSNRLEAHYAAGSSQPERLVASGQVRVRQRARQLSCDRATYYPAAERLECVGSALLQDGDNRVQGEQIEILFAQDRIRVKGGAVVHVAPDAKKKEAAKPAAGATP